SILEVTDILTAIIVAGFGSSFESLRLCHQGTNLPALPLLLDRDRSHAQALDLPHHLLVMDEVQLMQVVEVMQEELHVPCLFGQNQAALLLSYSIVMHKLVESAIRNRIALNIT